MSLAVCVPDRYFLKAPYSTDADRKARRVRPARTLVDHLLLDSSTSQRRPADMPSCRRGTSSCLAWHRRLGRNNSGRPGTSRPRWPSRLLHSSAKLDATPMTVNDDVSTRNSLSVSGKQGRKIARYRGSASSRIFICNSRLSRARSRCFEFTLSCSNLRREGFCPRTSHAISVRRHPRSFIQQRQDCGEYGGLRFNFHASLSRTRGQWFITMSFKPSCLPEGKALV